MLPKDEWHGTEFVEADGTVCEVKFSGKHMPASEIERGNARCQKQGRPLGRTIKCLA